MPTITINTHTQPSGLSYAWDLHWDIKSKDDACREYLRLKDKLNSIPKTLAQMEELALKDGFELPTKEYFPIVDSLIRDILSKNEGKILLLIPKGNEMILGFGVDAYMSLTLYNTEFPDNDEVNPHPYSNSIVDIEGRFLNESSYSKLVEIEKLLLERSYLLLTAKDLVDYLDAKLKETDED